MQRRHLLGAAAVLAAFALLLVASARKGGEGLLPSRAAAPAEPPAAAAAAGARIPVPSPPAPAALAAAPAATTAPRVRPDPAAAVLAAFDAWSQAVAAGGAADVPEGVALATARREVLRELIPADPARALAAAVPWSARQALPPEVQALLEEPVNATGEFLVLCAFSDAPWRREAQGMLRYFTADGRTWRAFVHGRRLTQQSVARLAVHGIAVDDVLAVSEDAGRVLEPAEAAARTAAGEIPDDARCALSGRPADPATRVVVQHGEQFAVLADGLVAAGFRRRLADAEGGFRRPVDPPVSPEWTMGRKTLLFMRVKFPDDPREPITEGEAHEVMSAANDYFVRASYNQLSIATTVGPLVTLPNPKMYYAAVGPGALLADAREATAAAGFEFTAYDLDIVRHENVPGFTWGGLGALGGRGAWLQGSSLGVVVHELGHNLGLAHANLWRTTRPPRPADPAGLPFDSASRVGLDSVYGPGDDVEYGDPFDIMGSGPAPEGEFTALHKRLLSWLPADTAAEIRTNGAYRLHAHDSGRLLAGRFYALTFAKDPDRRYWLSLRGHPALNTAGGRRPGLEVHWNNWYQAIGTAGLLDTTPGTPDELADARIPVGRTFADEEAQVFVTPVASFGLPPGPAATNEPAWMDVVVNLGPFPGNRPPSASLAASTLQAAPGQPVTFTVDAGDADGDAVAYWWDFGGIGAAPNTNVVTRSWTTPGDYVVRCEVSDMKGGVTAKHVVVRVGNPNTLRIAGRVYDNAGQPLAGVWVHNGLEGTNRLYATNYVHALSDSDGAYTLVGLQPGAFDLAAHKGGHLVEPLNFSLPFQLNAASGAGADFIAIPQTTVTVTKVGDMDEGRGTPGVFRLTRDGATNDTLRVYFRLGGTAEAGVDFEDHPLVETQTNTVQTALGPASIPIDFYYADIPAGEYGVDLTFTPIPDGETEGDETLTLTLAYPVGFFVEDGEDLLYFDIPGWERRTVNGVESWHQTRPQYRLGHAPTAEMIIVDDRPAALPVVSIIALDGAVSENDQDAAVLMIARFGAPLTEPLTVALAVEGTATPGEDYVPLPGSVVIPAGRGHVLLRVEAREDSFVEGNETVVVNLLPLPTYTVGAGQAQVIIVDNDLPVVTAHAVTPRAPENGGVGRVRFQRSGDLGQPLVVDYLLTGTATAGLDYVIPTGQLTIPAGAAAATLEITMLNDTLPEGDETIIVTIGSSPLYNVGQPGRATITIVDDELPTVVAGAPVNDITEGGEPGRFTITRSPAAGPLTVFYRFSGTARHQGDFIASGDRVNFLPGQATVTIEIITIDDAFREDDEVAVLELLPGPGYQVGEPGQAAITIRDNDGGAQPAVGFALLASSAPESAGTVNLAVQVSANPAAGDENTITVEYAVIGGTATRGVDYELASGVIQFVHLDPDADNPFENRIALIPLTLLDDDLPELDETVVVRLRLAGTTNAPPDGGGGTIGTPIDEDGDGVFDGCDTDGDGVIDVPGDCPPDPNAPPPDVVFNGLPDVYLVHTFTILDDDRGTVGVTASTYALSEGGPPGAFILRRTGNLSEPLTVILQVHGTAVAGADFAPLPNFATFAPGQAEITLPVIPFDDPEQEYLETIILTLLRAPGHRISPASARMLLEDNDGTIEFLAREYRANEADGFAEIRVRRTSDTNVAATVAYEAVAGTARPGAAADDPEGDFLPVSGLLEFLPGEAVKAFLVPLINNTNVDSPPRTVLLRLVRATGLFPLGGQSTATLFILDDDSADPSDIQLAGRTTDYEQGGSAALVLTRLRDVEAPLTLLYHTRDGTALAGEDYEPEPAGVLEFGAGEATAEINVRFMDDEVVEDDEQFEIVITDASGFELVAVPVTILNDDTEIEFALAEQSVREDAGVVEVVVRRRGFVAPTMLVDYATTNLTALAGLDYEAAAGTLTFLGNRAETATDGSGAVLDVPGETAQTIVIRILNDDLGELDEQFLVGLANPRREQPGLGTVSLGAVNPAVITILDNEAPGEVDESFNPGLGADGLVRALAVQPDGRVVLGGDFGTVNGTVLPRIARLHTDGLVDNSFNPGRGLDGPVHAVAVLRDGRVLAGGAFTNAGLVQRRFLARLEADGTSLAGTNNVPAPNALVRALAALPDGGALVGGDFTAVANQPRPGLARLRPDGSLDPAFLPGPAAGVSVRALAADTEGRVLVGGAFNSFAGTGRNNLLRLGPDGRPDPLWLGGSPDGPVNALAVLPDGRILVGGAFNTVAGLPARGVARLNPDGTPDPGFNPEDGPNGPVLAVADGGDGRALVAGAFTQVAGVPRGRFARLAADGLPDPAFGGAGANDAVLALALQGDGAFFIGGAFTNVNGLPRRRIARVNADNRFPAGQVQFSAAAYEVGEGDGELVVEVQRGGSAKGVATVDWFTVDETATSPADFIAGAGTLIFADGQTNAAFAVAIVQDALIEGVETFRLVLTNAADVNLGRRAAAVVTIVDDEAAAGFTTTRAEVDEGAGRVRLTVRRTGDLSGPAEVTVATADGTAIAGEDYEALTATLAFAPGAATVPVEIRILDDTLLEEPESFRVRLTGASPPLAVGTQAEVVVTILDNDAPPTSWLLTVQPSPGGTAAPAGGRFPTNAVVTVTATPQAGFEFVQWEGTVAAADNPLQLLMDRDHVLTARFQPREYLEDFESGSFARLPWRFGGDAPWTITDATAGGGRFSARSGVIGHSRSSSLILEFETGTGTGTFDLRVSSEPEWDLLEFWVDGVRREKWSGEVPWRTYTFNVAAGPHRFEWRYVRDRTFVGGQDAAWIDNLDLPEPLPATPPGPAEPPRLALTPRAGGGVIVKVEGQPGRSYTLEGSADMRTWTPVATQVMSGALLFLEDRDAAGAARFYRATAR